MRSIWRHIDPRARLAAAIGWAVLGLVGFTALVAAQLASSEAEARARADTQRLLGQFATQIRDALDGSFETRHQLLQATAAQLLASSDLGAASVRRHLGAVWAQ
ncbi:MAG: hypothetical protein KGJ30_15740, partial [Burkholderiales bacterium]|nr:hypothetical protein [Burkholderiales bacterium]